MTGHARAAGAAADKKSRMSGRACHGARPAIWSGGAPRTTASDDGAQARGCVAGAHTRGCGAGAPDSCCKALQPRIRPDTCLPWQNGWGRCRTTPYWMLLLGLTMKMPAEVIGGGGGSAVSQQKPVPEPLIRGALFLIELKALINRTVRRIETEACRDRQVMIAVIGRTQLSPGVISRTGTTTRFVTVRSHDFSDVVQRVCTPNQ